MDSWNYKPARDLGMPMGQRLRSSKRESGLVGRLAQRLGGAAISVLLRRWEKITVEGRESLPTKPPFILISNHSSHFDGLVIASLLPAALRTIVFPIAAGDTFFETPTHALLAAGLLNALPMWRKSAGRHAIGELRSRLLGEPCGYILFPEGTRSRSGEIAVFRPGVGMLVAATPVPVTPCFLQGAHAAWPPNSKWPRRGAAITVRVGNPLNFQNVENDRQGWQKIATDLEQAVRALAN
jgi:1-acyl-sn-glycerol-3-phosphate acyltransferase